MTFSSLFEIPPFFMNKYSLDCCKPLFNFQSSKRVNFDNTCQSSFLYWRVGLEDSFLYSLKYIILDIRFVALSSKYFFFTSSNIYSEPSKLSLALWSGFLKNQLKKKKKTSLKLLIMSSSISMSEHHGWGPWVSDMGCSWLQNYALDVIRMCKW